MRLVGDPGIGKTRLTEEFSAHAKDADVEVLVGRCFEGPGAPAFWPWLQVVRAGERALLTVTKGIGAALARIEGEPPALGAHLRATVRRGYFCLYVPDSRYPTDWEL